MVREDYAMTETLRNENLKKAMERKAAKCIEIAESRLGKYASASEIEDLALRFMDLPNSVVNGRVASLRNADNAVQMNTGYEGLDFTGPGNAGSDLEADEWMSDEFEADMDMMADELEADEWMSDEFEADMDMMADEFEADELEADMDMMAEDIEAHDLFDEYDLDGDDLISRDEWGGSMGAFDVMDLDEDDFLSRDEVAMGLGDSFGNPSQAEMLAEEISNLKQANARLARQVRKLADNAVQQATDYTVEDFSDPIDTTPESEEGEGTPTQRLARLERLASVLADYMGELEAEEEMSDMNDPHYGYSKAAGDEPEEEEGDDEDLEEDAKNVAETAEDPKSEKKASEDLEEEEAEEEETESEKKASDDNMGLDVEDGDMEIDPRLASIFTASDEEEAEEEEAEEEETEGEEPKSEKKASYKPAINTRQASVKTLGNISREASASSDELSKLWASAPDVSKFFG
jgi:hypothetical protein